MRKIVKYFLGVLYRILFLITFLILEIFIFPISLLSILTVIFFNFNLLFWYMNNMEIFFKKYRYLIK